MLELQRWPLIHYSLVIVTVTASVATASTSTNSYSWREFINAWHARNYFIPVSSTGESWMHPGIPTQYWVHPENPHFTSVAGPHTVSASAHRYLAAHNVRGLEQKQTTKQYCGPEAATTQTFKIGTALSPPRFVYLSQSCIRWTYSRRLFVLSFHKPHQLLAQNVEAASQRRGETRIQTNMRHRTERLTGWHQPWIAQILWLNFVRLDRVATDRIYLLSPLSCRS